MTERDRLNFVGGGGKANIYDFMCTTDTFLLGLLFAKQKLGGFMDDIG